MNRGRAKGVYKRNLGTQNQYKLGEPVVGVKAVVSLKGREQSGTIVYKRKAEYKDMRRA